MFFCSCSNVNDTKQWLLENRFDAELFEGCTGSELADFSREDIFNLCGPVHGVRLYNSLNKGIYISLQEGTEYLPILVEKPTCDFLKTWIARGLSIPPSRITALLVEDRYGKLVPMDNLSLKGINKRIYFDIKQEVDEKGSMRITLKESPTKDENGKRGQHSKS
ncbi:PREDICTED: uncharacterized protein LOC109581507 isoform X4 [Amphimedon queenslandica]|uniref:SAM domain-containing protein n=1 Tax=Amphimedon queenslandica TaxID=400682 RepID=A0AAN0J3C9_AMPQE|nr:PREDICTED: uncharacterized protein LOC109581507 isoform X4 [Amphimedon queenslandica]|eukprot:XP_019851226.1 PREDICTED: uncharacterized protein LOC109581507 isoform X4 [Amphimedon queenslandica]